MRYTLKQHLNYNLWANGKIADFIANADEKLFDMEVISSFPSLRKTVYHIWDAEYIWLKRMQGESLSEWPSKNFNGSATDATDGWLACSQQLLEHIGVSDADYASSTITYQNMKGDEFTTTVEGIVMHVVNHGTFHRGQIITMLRQLGYTNLSSTDLITFLRL